MFSSGISSKSRALRPSASFVLLNDGFEGNDELEQELIEHCKNNMAAYKRPRWVAFVAELPKTATGKIRKTELREVARRLSQTREG